MPELPEVETIVRDLQTLVTGATIRSAKVHRPDLIVGDAPAFHEALMDRTIESVSRRAKNIVLDLSRDCLVINLGMTGRVTVQASDLPHPPYVGVELDLRDGRTLLYQDVRRFGRLEVMSRHDWEARSNRIGLEPLSPEFTPQVLHALTRTSRVAIKTWLMDQRHVVGIGNIYASEALFRAQISPRRAARRLSRRHAEALHAAIRTVLQEAIEFRGTTLLDYRDATGGRGEFSRRLRVYDRLGEACIDCGSPIRRIVQGGRSTFFCARCQR